MTNDQQRSQNRTQRPARPANGAARGDRAASRAVRSAAEQAPVKRKKTRKSNAKTEILYILVGAIVCAALALLLTNYLGKNGTGATGEFEKPVSAIQSSSSPVLITEVMSDNSSVIQDTYQNFADWFEVTNVSGGDVNLYGWKVARDTDTTKFFEFPDYTLKSGQAVVVFCTNVLENKAGYEFHAPFKLSSAGCMLILYDSNGRAMQSFNVPDLKANNSYAYIDGNWTVTAEATPGRANTHENYVNLRQNRTVTSSPIMITELMAKNTCYAPDENGEYVDWVEIYNSSSQTVSLYNYALSDGEDNLRKWIFPNISIGPGQYMLIYCSGYDRRDPNGRLHTNFKLSTEKECAILTDAQGNIIDLVEYDLLKADQSLSRLSDGSWVTNKAPTPGLANTSDSAALISAQFAARNSSGVFINEVMASTTVALTRNAPSYDWLELRNNTNQTVDISGYGLSDNSAKPRKWQFPNGTTIAPGGYLPVYLSGTGTDSTEPSPAPYYTNFRLSSTEGETLVFSDPTGQVLDICYLGAQYSDISYGRLGSSTDSGFVYLTESTPGRQNVGTGYAEHMDAPSFSQPGGLYPAGTVLTLNLSCEPGATVYYTLDASEPNVGDLNGHTFPVDPEFSSVVSGQTRTYRYSGPITIDKTTVVRAMTVKDGQLNSQVATQTYFVGVSHTMDVVSLVLDPEDLWSYEYMVGLYVKGPNATSKSPYGSPDKGANFWSTAEKAANVEVFGEDGSTVLSQACGVRLHGQYSRTEKQKSFKIIARSKYGSNRFFAALFSNRDYTEYQSFLLRSSGQDWNKTRMRDSILSALAADIYTKNQDPASPLYQPDTHPVMYQETELSVVYLNGVYWGEYNLRERINAFSICQWEGWDPAVKDSIDLQKANDTVMQGTKESWTSVKDWYTKNGLDTDEKLAYIEQKVDVWNYLNWCAVQIYTGNTDLLNCKKYRCELTDGKWRWVLFDLDWAFTTDTNSINRWWHVGGVEKTDKSSAPLDNSLFLALMDNNKCKDYFMTLLADMLANEWSTDSIVSRIQSRYFELEPEIDQHQSRWGMSRSEFDSAVKSFVSYAQKRPGRLLYFLSNKFSKNEFEHYFGELARSVDLIDDKGKSFSYYK
ncbi:MAG: lamin tail domain-containing protein [Clostridia bacterium]|nr:lamin tail domain-containing protein [Clostridia bacterium]